MKIANVRFYTYWVTSEFHNVIMTTEHTYLKSYYR